MKIFFLYIFRLNFLALMIITLGLSLAVWLTQSIRIIEFVVGGGAPLFIFFKLLVLTLPSFLVLTLPIAVLISITFTYNKLTQDRELVILRSGGLSAFKLAGPSLAFILIVTILCYVLAIEVAPKAQHNLIKLQSSVKNDFTSILLREGVFNDIQDDLTVFIKEKSKDGQLLGLMIHDTKNKGKPATILAERGQIHITPEGRSVVVYDGIRQEYEEATGKVSELNFDKYSFDLKAYAKLDAIRWLDPKERNFKTLLKGPESERDFQEAKKFKVELHRRLSMPLYTIGFGLLGLYFMLKGQYSRQENNRKIVLILAAAMLVRSLGFGFENMSIKNLDYSFMLYVIPLSPLILIAGIELVQRMVRR